MSPDASLLIGPAILAALSLPLILKVVPPNRIYGWRTPKTLANEVLWYRANSFAGWAFLVAALVSLALLLAMRHGTLPAVSPEIVAIVIPVLLAMMACFVYLRRIAGNEARGRE